MGFRIHNPASKRKPPMECYWLLAPDCPGGMAFIPECWGGVHSGPDGCYCNEGQTEDLDEQIEATQGKLNKLLRERARRNEA